MTCQEARLLMAEELGGTHAVSIELSSHMKDCAACHAEADEIRAIWTRLGGLPEPEPRPWMATRFYAALDAYEQGLRERRPGFWRWWPSRPVWQVGVSLGCLAAGLLAGTMLVRHSGTASSNEIAELHKEMTGMRQMVTLSLLQQQSAAERLRGVTWSYRAEPNDLEVLGALLRTVTTDSNVDVRLAGVEALRNFGDSQVARRGLINALPKQDSPLVQISIVDALAELKDRNARLALEALLAKPNLDPNVRQRITDALRSPGSGARISAPQQ